MSFDDPDHKLSAVRKAARELTDGMHEADAAVAKAALFSMASSEAVEGTGLARALGEALEFARKHAEGALKAIEHAKNTALPKARKRGSTAAVASSSDARGKRAAAAATLRLAVSALVAAASACNDAARWGTRGPEASRAAADAISYAAGEELWLSVTEEYELTFFAFASFFSRRRRHRRRQRGSSLLPFSFLTLKTLPQSRHTARPLLLPHGPLHHLPLLLRGNPLGALHLPALAPALLAGAAQKRQLRGAE